MPFPIVSTAGLVGRRAFLCGAGATASLALTGCQTIQNMASDPTQAIAFAQNVMAPMQLGEPDEIAIGTGLYPRIIAQSGGAYKNAAVQGAVERFAEPIFRTSKRPQLPWEIVVLDDNSVNAWALPGGKIGVNKGLLRYVADEAELAAVISHEMGHAELGHGIAAIRTERFSRSLTGVGKQILQQEADSAGLGFASGPVLDAIEEPMIDIVVSGYSREAEREADAYILSVFGQTGHDPRRASSFFKTLLQLIPPDSDKTTSLFSSHPDTVDRIVLIEEAAAAMPASGPGPTAGFGEIKTVFPTRSYYRREYTGAV